MISRKEKEKQTKITEIIKAAENLFIKKGFEHVTMDMIAKESEFTRSTLYLYFRNKEELFTLVYLNISKMRWNLLKQAMDNQKTGYEKLNAYGKEYYNYAVKYPQYFRLGMHLDKNGMDYKKISQEIMDEFNTERIKAREELEASFKIGEKDGTLIKFDDIVTNIKYLIFSLRTMINEVILGYERADFYFGFLDFYLSAIKN